MVVRTNSEMAALEAARSLHVDAMEVLQQQQQQQHAGRTPWKKSTGKAAAARRDRALLTRLLFAALLVAFLTGSTSYRMTQALRWEQGMEHAASGGGSASLLATHGTALFSGLRSWLGTTHSSRRSLRQRSPREEAAKVAAADASTGVQLHEHWYLLGNPSSRPAADAELADESPLARLLKRRRQATAIRLYHLEDKAWVQKHNLTRFPPEVPVANWAAASLLNKAKKKESVIFLLGGHMSSAEAAAGRPPRPKPPPGTVTKRSVASSTKRPAMPTNTCPQASSGVFSINPGRSRVKTLPQLPQPRFGGTAVVLGARLHFLGGFATDKATRLATLASEHWSIGLNADGSSAPEWQEEEPLPIELLGSPISVALTPDELTGEPAIFAWRRTGGSIGGSSSSAECFADAVAAAAAGVGAEGDKGSSDSSGRGSNAVERRKVAMWSFSTTTGWKREGSLPQPLADDFQCAVAASNSEFLAVGAVERSGLFTWQRGIWQYDARDGGSWMRAGWAPEEFEGPLCALHDGRLFISNALPPLDLEPDQAAAEDELDDDLVVEQEEEAEEAAVLAQEEQQGAAEHVQQEQQQQVQQEQALQLEQQVVAVQEQSQVQQAAQEQQQQQQLGVPQQLEPHVSGAHQPHEQPRIGEQAAQEQQAAVAQHPQEQQAANPGMAAVDSAAAGKATAQQQEPAAAASIAIEQKQQEQQAAGVERTTTAAAQLAQAVAEA